MPIENEGQEPQNETDVDALLASVENQNIDVAPPPKVEEYSFKVGGKEIKAPMDKVLRWAEQGYDAPNRIGDLNKKLTEYQGQANKWKEIEDRFSKVDEYARANPQWWESINSEYEKVKATQAPVNPALLQEIDGLKNSFKTIEQERTEQKNKQEDEQYQKEIESLKKSYPKVDFATKGSDGQSLEYKVLQYAVDNGIKKFTTAFRDFYHDELMKINEASAKEKVISDKQTKTKLGILGDIQTPSRKVFDSNIKNKSYKDLEKEALAEYGIT